MQKKITDFKNWNRIKILKDNSEIISFCISFVIILLLLIISNVKEYRFGDASGYWNMSTSMINNGILNFKFIPKPETDLHLLYSIRGYSWPFLIAILRLIGFNNFYGWIITYSLFLAGGYIYVISGLFDRIFNINSNTIQKLFPLLITIILWPGLIIYPLSDIPAIITLSFAFLIILKNKSKVNIGTYEVIKLIIAGILLGISYYIRSGNLVSIILILTLVIFSDKITNIKKQKIIIIFLISIGIVISMIPQIIINDYVNGECTYKVPIFFTTGIANQSFLSSTERIRYETNTSYMYNSPIISADTSAADNIYRYENINKETLTKIELIKLIIKHPIEFLGIYSLKFINGIDSRYGEIYISNLIPYRTSKITLNFIIWFFAIIGIFFQLGISNEDISDKKNNCKNKILCNIEIMNFLYFCKKYGMIVFIFVAPAFVHLFGTHMEARYLYPLFLMALIYLSKICPVKNLINHVLKKPITYIVFFIFALGLSSGIWSLTFDLIENSDVIFEKPPKKIILSDNRGIENIKSNEGELYLLTEVFSFKDNNVYFQAHTFIENLNSKDTDAKLILKGKDVMYEYDLSLKDRKDVDLNYNLKNDNMYLKSGIIFEKDVSYIDSGIYSILISLENKDKKVIKNSTYTIEVDK